jgi:hypothetical protein
MKTIHTSIDMGLVKTGTKPSRPAINFITGCAMAFTATLLLLQYTQDEILTKSVVAKSLNKAAIDNQYSSSSDIAEAFENHPLNQNLVNAGLLLKLGNLSSDSKNKWIAVIGKMGWRSTAATQTLINEALRKQDLRSLVVFADVLLRRQKLFDQAAHLMIILEAAPSTKQDVYARLERGVPWRAQYLQLSSSIKQPIYLDARVQTLNHLQEAGVRLARQEIAPSIEMMVLAGRLKDAEQIWRNSAQMPSTALHDGYFRLAVKADPNRDFIIPFEWQFYSGNGFAAYPYDAGPMGPKVNIQWDGRGLPILMSQMTSAKGGNYQISFAVDGNRREFANSIGVRFRCGNEVIRTQNVLPLNNQIVSAKTVAPITCDFPWVDVYGQIQDRRKSINLAFFNAELNKIDE